MRLYKLEQSNDTLFFKDFFLIHELIKKNSINSYPDLNSTLKTLVFEKLVLIKT